MSSNKSDQANALYESDFYGWTELQAKALATRQVEALDWQNLREEVISLGKQEYRELVSRLTVLVGHLLKWEYQLTVFSPSRTSWPTISSAIPVRIGHEFNDSTISPRRVFVS